jgi:hypothetical protein
VRDSDAMRVRHTKLVRDAGSEKLEMYDLGMDLGETQDKSPAHAEQMERRPQALEGWKQQLSRLRTGLVEGLEVDRANYELP